jgi:hypothetical protein
MRYAAAVAVVIVPVAAAVSQLLVETYGDLYTSIATVLC